MAAGAVHEGRGRPRLRMAMSASIEAPSLQLGDGAAKGVPLLHVSPRASPDGAPGQMPDGLRPDGGATSIERVHGDGEALALRTDPVRPRDAHLVEDHFARGAAPKTELVLVLGDVKAPLLLDQEARDTATAGVGVGLGEDDVDVGDPGVGDPVL